MRVEKMRIFWNITLLLFAVTTIFSSGCSNLDSLVRSVENTFGKDKHEAGIDAAALDEAGKAWQTGHLVLAEERYKDYIEKNQRSEDKASLAVAHSQLGRIAYDKSDFQASNRYFEDAIKLDPDNLDLRGLYSESLYRQKEYIRAETLCHQALQVAPNDRRFQITLGLTMAQQKQYQAGLRYLKQALGEQGAYEEIARIYHGHSEFGKAALAMSKARESYSKQQQLAANFPNGGFPNGVSVPAHVEPQRATVPVTQFPVATQTQPYQPVQTAFPPQQQQSGMMSNTTYSHQPQYPPSQNYSANIGANNGTMNPAVQPGHYPDSPMPPHQVMPPQQAFPQQPQDNRPPQGFAAMQQPMSATPIAGQQTLSAPFQHNAREIAYHPNYSDTQPGVMQPGTLYPATSSGTPSPINPLAERVVSSEPSSTPSPANSAIPMNGNWNNQTRNPVFFGYPI